MNKYYIQNVCSRIPDSIKGERVERCGVYLELRRRESAGLTVPSKQVSKGRRRNKAMVDNGR